MISKISRASDSIWRTADLEFGDPHENEEEWFRDKHNMYDNYGSERLNEKLMTLVPGWDEAKRRGWKPLDAPSGPIAYRGSKDRFEFIGPKHLNPDDPHWERIPQRWIRYSLGEGGDQDPSVMHADTFKDALDDREVRKWRLYKSDYDPETGEFHRTLNDQYPYNHHRMGPGAFTDVFDGRGDIQKSHFHWIRGHAAKRDYRLAGGANGGNQTPPAIR